MTQRVILPRIADRVRISAGWGRHLKRERVGLMLISLAQQGVITIPLDHLIVLLRQHGFPSIANALREQVEAGRVGEMAAIDPEDPNAVRPFVKDVIRKGLVNGQ